MEYFKSSIKSVLGTPASPESQPSEDEMIVRLVDRLESSTLLDDRRDACRALKAFSKNHRVAVGAHGINALVQVLQCDKTDHEIIALALDTLCNITSPEDKESTFNVGEQFTEIFIKKESSVTEVLTFLEEFDFKVRWPALKVLANLLKHKPKAIQEIILVSPMGISKLIDILDDSREVIRNDALLILIQLIKGNSNIQKIVAFENAFDRIFILIDNEGGLDGGIVVEDCLMLMYNLLKGNYSNQNFFKEGSYVLKLKPMFDTLTSSPEDNVTLAWSAQKMANVYWLSEIVRALVDPNGPAQVVADCQKKMKKCGLLDILCNLLMMSGVPPQTLTVLINTVADIIRGNEVNQDFLANVMAPISPPRPAILVLLMSMINEKQPFLLRCAVLYCFQCFLYKNEGKQMELVQTLLPQGNERPSLTSGQLLCGGLCSPDSLSNWFSAVALSHALIDGNKQKEQLVRVLLATNIGTPPVSLMSQCVTLLQQNNNIQSKLGFLMLLCRWTAYSTLTVKSFLSIDSSVSYIVALLSSHESTDDIQEILLQSMCAFLIGICVHFNDDSLPKYTKSMLVNVVENRIGLEKFQDTIENITKHEVYSRSLKHPQLSVKEPADILLDHEFCRLLKDLESTVLKSVLTDKDSNNHIEDSQNYNLPENPMIAQYKDLIRDQDAKITQLNETVNNLTKEKQELELQVNELKSKVDSLSDENKVLRAANASFMSSPGKENVDYKKAIEDLTAQLHQYEERIRQLENSNHLSEIEQMKRDHEDLLELLAHQDQTIAKYAEKFATLGIDIDADIKPKENNDIDHINAKVNNIDL